MWQDNQRSESQDKWEDIGVIAQTKASPSRPATIYKAYDKAEVVLYDKAYRAVVIHSSAHDKRRQKRIEKELEKSCKALKAQCDNDSKTEYFCQADAQTAARKLKQAETEYYEIDVCIEERPKYAKGRPQNGIRKVKEMRYGIRAEVKEKKEAISIKHKEAGCFVLISNVPKEGEQAYDASSILRTYKEQNGIEQNFGFLKDPLIVNDLFLKKPERIEALSLILLISLLIWRLMEQSLRQHVESKGEQLIGWNQRPTDRPTSFMMTTKFNGVIVIKINDMRMLSRPLSDVQKNYLRALGVGDSIFTNLRDA